MRCRTSRRIDNTKEVTAIKIFVTHNPQPIMDMCSRTLALSRSRALALLRSRALALALSVTTHAYHQRTGSTLSGRAGAGAAGAGSATAL
jgi:hypothetical protein